MEQFVAWLVAFMITLAPPGRKHYIPEAKETETEALERYGDIARDLAEVLTDEKENVITRGSQAKIRMAAIIVSVMLHESGFRRDVDFGKGKYARGDNGNSWCLMQLNVGKGKTKPWNYVRHRFAFSHDNPEEVLPGWSGEELVADRKNCIRAGLHMINATSCTSQGPLGWLRGYASGSCSRGEQASRSRVGLALRWLSSHRPEFRDADLYEAPPSTESLVIWDTKPKENLIGLVR